MITETGSANVKNVLNVPTVGPAHYEKNFIRQVVCEFRFPTLFELENAQPPLAFAQALRKEYPNYSQLTGLSVNANGLEKSRGHSFASKGNRWAVNLRASTISLETSFYNAFSDFENRLESVLSAAQKIIDTEYFTRIGLRYINSVPFKRQEIGSWVNPVLVGPLAQGVYGDAEEYSQRVSGRTECGGFLFTHGITRNSEGAHVDYLLDFDFFQEDVAVKGSMDVVKRLHTAEFSMFMWSLAEKAKNELGHSTIKASGAK